MGTMRLDRLLSNLGYGSRREVDEMAASGRITLDGQKVTKGDKKVVLSDDLPHRLLWDGTPIDPLPGIVILLYKPLGATCSHKEAGTLVYHLLPERWRRRDPQISSVGRLDKETSGLLLLTDDGLLLHKIISPKQHVAKRYIATLDRPLQGNEETIFGSGTLMLEGETKPLLPVEMETLSPTSIRLTLHEGRYHQVRRMLAAVGNHVATLHRESVGGLTIPESMKPGDFRILSSAEIQAIFADT